MVLRLVNLKVWHPGWHCHRKQSNVLYTDRIPFIGGRGDDPKNQNSPIYSYVSNN